MSADYSFRTKLIQGEPLKLRKKPTGEKTQLRGTKKSTLNHAITISAGS